MMKPPCRKALPLGRGALLSSLTKDLEFDMSGVGNPKKKGEVMGEKVIFYGKAV